MDDGKIMLTTSNFRPYIIATLLLTLSACSTIEKSAPWYRANAVDSISVYVVPDPNIRYAISIDVVFIYQEVALTVLTTMSAQDWFLQKDALLSAYGNQIDLLQWQIINGFGDNQKPLPNDHKEAIAVIAYANYPPNPNAKADLTTLRNPWLIIENGELSAKVRSPALSNNTKYNDRNVNQ